MIYKTPTHPKPAPHPAQVQHNQCRQVIQFPLPFSIHHSIPLLTTHHTYPPSSLKKKLLPIRRNRYLLHTCRQFATVESQVLSWGFSHNHPSGDARIFPLPLYIYREWMHVIHLGARCGKKCYSKEAGPHYTAYFHIQRPSLLALIFSTG